MERSVSLRRWGEKGIIIIMRAREVDQTVMRCVMRWVVGGLIV